MRTTLVLDDEVVHKAKLKAAEQGTTLSQFTNKALREMIAPKGGKDSPAAAFTMLTYGPKENAEIRVQDIKSLRDELK